MPFCQFSPSSSHHWRRASPACYNCWWGSYEPCSASCCSQSILPATTSSLCMLSLWSRRLWVSGHSSPPPPSPASSNCLWSPSWSCLWHSNWSWGWLFSSGCCIYELVQGYTEGRSPAMQIFIKHNLWKKTTLTKNELNIETRMSSNIGMSWNMAEKFAAELS